VEQKEDSGEVGDSGAIRSQLVRKVKSPRRKSSFMKQNYADGGGPRGLVREPLGLLKRVPQKLTDFCDKNALQLFDPARFLIARTIPFERKAR
jgi:hypothetical protein